MQCNAFFTITVSIVNIEMQFCLINRAISTWQAAKEAKEAQEEARESPEPRRRSPPDDDSYSLVVELFLIHFFYFGHHLPHLLLRKWTSCAPDDTQNACFHESLVSRIILNRS